MKGFREFILRGNVVDLAVAVVIGAAFAALVAALVKDLITPLIAAIGGKPDFSEPVVHDQQVDVQLRRLHQRADHVPDHRRRRLLPRHQAGRRPAGAVRAQEGGGAAARVPGVPLGRPLRRAPLRVLHGGDLPGLRRVRSTTGHRRPRAVRGPALAAQPGRRAAPLGSGGPARPRSRVLVRGRVQARVSGRGPCRLTAAGSAAYGRTAARAAEPRPRGLRGRAWALLRGRGGVWAVHGALGPGGSCCSASPSRCSPGARGGRPARRRSRTPPRT